jgi:hypothetical protein
MNPLRLDDIQFHQEIQSIQNVYGARHIVSIDSDILILVILIINTSKKIRRHTSVYIHRVEIIEEKKTPHYVITHHTL